MCILCKLLCINLSMVLTSSCSACSECSVISDACFCFRWVYHKYKDHLLLADQDILNVLFGISPWYVLWCIKNTVMNWMNRRDLQTKTWQTTVIFLEVWRGHLLTGSIVFHLDKYQDHTESPSPDVRMPPILQGSNFFSSIYSAHLGLEPRGLPCSRTHVPLMIFWK